MDDEEDMVGVSLITSDLREAFAELELKEKEEDSAGTEGDCTLGIVTVREVDMDDEVRGVGRGFVELRDLVLTTDGWDDRDGDLVWAGLDLWRVERRRAFDEDKTGSFGAIGHGRGCDALDGDLAVS
jgi:hypothetical protein